MPRFITELKRTNTCGELTKADIGKEVVLFGWVNNRRDHGGAVFIDLRDRAGVTQVVFEEDVRPEVHELAGQLRLEYCVGLRGKVVSRGGNVNPRLKTGEIEVHATELEIFNRSEPVPFPVEDKIDTSEEKRLQYRYLDLKRHRLGAVEDLELGGVDLDLAGLEPRVHVAAAGDDLAPDADAVLQAKLPGELVHLRPHVRLEHDLGDALAVPQVDEDRAAVVAPVVHPAEEDDVLADVPLGELATGVRALGLGDEAGQMGSSGKEQGS